jgi:putative alpha-1,2-mannosidase
VYTLTPPSFDRIEVRPAGGPSTTIVSPGATPTHRYLNGISIDGSALETRSVTQRQLAGATLEMITSPTPTALRADTAPPSASSDPLSRFDCVA